MSVRLELYLSHVTNSYTFTTSVQEKTKKKPR